MVVYGGFAGIFAKRGSRVKSLVLKELKKYLKQPETFQYVEQRFSRMFDYNCVGGKMLRGQMVVENYWGGVVNKRRGGIEDAYQLGWALEMTQAFLLIADDIMDHSAMRRGKVCWYKNSDIGLSAVNDAMFLENVVEIVLRDLVSNKLKRAKLLDAYHEARIATTMGQMLDMKRKTLDECTPELYKEIVRLKTSTYSFVLPFQWAMIYGEQEDMLRPDLLDFFYTFGYLFQIADDIKDVTSPTSETGKTAVDVAERKCAWPLVTAAEILKQRDPPQYNQLKKLFESDDASHNAEILSIIRRHDYRKKFTDLLGNFIVKQETDLLDPDDCTIPDGLRAHLQRYLGGFEDRFVAVDKVQRETIS